MQMFLFGVRIHLRFVITLNFYFVPHISIVAMQIEIFHCIPSRKQITICV